MSWFSQSEHEIITILCVWDQLVQTPCWQCQCCFLFSLCKLLINRLLPCEEAVVPLLKTTRSFERTEISEVET